jgi:hypothetical protein
VTTPPPSSGGGEGGEGGEGVAPEGLAPEADPAVPTAGTVGVDRRADDEATASDAGPGARGGGTGAGHRPGRRWSRWRERRVVVPAVVAAVSLTLGGVLAYSGRSEGDGGGADGGPLPTMPSTTVNAGGIDVPTPDGWTAAPVPDLRFGIAVPPGWEAAVLTEEMLASLPRSSPAVEGFVDAAHAAAESDALFYGAGQDRDGRVSDVKVRAVPGTGIADAAGLRAYAEQLAGDAGLVDPVIEPVGGADRPTVRIRFTTRSQSPDGDTVTTQGTETLVAGPGDIVWSVIVTSEDAATHDDLAARITATFTLV